MLFRNAKLLHLYPTPQTWKIIRTTHTNSGMKRADGASNITSITPTVRPVGSTELTLCKALAGGTGVTVIGLLFSKHQAASTVQNVLGSLQNAHPILRSRLRYHSVTKTFSFVTFSAPFVKVEEFDSKATSSTVLQPGSPSSELEQIVEHELNEDIWARIQSSSNDDVDVFCAKSYELENGMRALALQFLTAALDRTSGVSLLREFLARLATQGIDIDVTLDTEIGVALEDLNPKKTAKSVWSTGKSLLSSTVTSVGLTNLSFKDSKFLPRSSRIIRMELDQVHTLNLLNGCESRGIKLLGALAAAGMIAAHSVNTNRNSDNFGVVTVFDCRPTLNQPLSSNEIGFYSTGLITSHAVNKTETFWNLAEKTYAAFTKSKKTNKHFTDMALINYLMCKAIDNPALTPSSSQRTSLLSVFEEPAVLNNDCWMALVGLEDFVSCASGHGVGPSITITDTVHEGQLKCTLSYPAPLHSREQIVEMVDKMKSILIDATN